MQHADHLQPVPASDVMPGDSIKFLLGGLAHVRGVTDLGDGLLSVSAEVSIYLRDDEIVTLAKRPANNTTPTRQQSQADD